MKSCHNDSYAPSTIKIHLQPSYPPKSSICVIAAANKPENAPDKAAIQNNAPRRTPRSEGMYHAVQRYIAAGKNPALAKKMFGQRLTHLACPTSSKKLLVSVFISLENAQHESTRYEARKVLDDTLHARDQTECESTCTEIVGWRSELFQNGVTWYFCRGRKRAFFISTCTHTHTQACCHKLGRLQISGCCRTPTHFQKRREKKGHCSPKTMYDTKKIAKAVLY